VIAESLTVILDRVVPKSAGHSEEKKRPGAAENLVLTLGSST